MLIKSCLKLKKQTVDVRMAKQNMIGQVRQFRTAHPATLQCVSPVSCILSYSLHLLHPVSCILYPTRVCCFPVVPGSGILHFLATVWSGRPLVLFRLPRAFYSSIPSSDAKGSNQNQAALCSCRKVTRVRDSLVEACDSTSYSSSPFIR